MDVLALPLHLPTRAETGWVFVVVGVLGGQASEAFREGFSRWVLTIMPIVQEHWRTQRALR